MSENKKCPFCAEMIDADAVKCPYCSEELPLVKQAVQPVIPQPIKPIAISATPTEAAPPPQTGSVSFTKGWIAWIVSAGCMWWACGAFHRFMSFGRWAGSSYDKRFKYFTDVLKDPDLQTLVPSLPSARGIVIAGLIASIMLFAAFEWRCKENLKRANMELNCYFALAAVLIFLYPNAAPPFLFISSLPFLMIAVFSLIRKAGIPFVYPLIFVLSIFLSMKMIK